MIANAITFIGKYYSYFITGTGVTLFLSFFGVLSGVIIGVFLALMKLSKNLLQLERIIIK